MDSRDVHPEPKMHENVVNMKSAASEKMPSPDMDLSEIRANAQRAANLLKSMGNPARLMVLCQLTTGEKSVGELERAVPMSQSALSQHLALLRMRNLVKTRRAGQSIYYSLAGVEASSILAALYDLFCAKSSAAAAPRRHKTGKQAV
jgi:ArsR family transcriptional regulator, virulence genes transcriptional regulator